MKVREWGRGSHQVRQPGWRRNGKGPLLTRALFFQTWKSVGALGFQISTQDLFGCPSQCTVCRRCRIEGSGASWTQQQHLHWYCEHRYLCQNSWNSLRIIFAETNLSKLNWSLNFQAFGKCEDMSYLHSLSHLVFAYSISQGVVQLNLDTNFLCKFASLRAKEWRKWWILHMFISFPDVCKCRKFCSNLQLSSLPTIDDEHWDLGRDSVMNIL